MNDQLVRTAQPSILIDARFGWTTRPADAGLVHWIGEADDVDALCAVIARNPDDIDGLSAVARSRYGTFSLIVETPNRIFAIGDRVRGYPLFYSPDTRSPAISNSARLIAEREGLTAADPTALLEFILAGYTIGTRTTVGGVEQLLSGELLVWDRVPEALPMRRRYARYRPAPEWRGTERDYVAALGEVTDRVFQRVAKRAAGARIWIPLSGGYDSRLIACKLRELGYPRLKAFTYGPPNNSEERIAREVANRLDLEWTFVPSRAGDARQSFDQDRRREYWRFADGLCVIPSMREWQAMNHLVGSGQLTPEDVVINGQSGDYLSGGHIPAALWHDPAPTADGFFEAILGKHFGLWTNFHTPENLAIVRASIVAALDGWSPDSGEKDDLIARYEEFEFQERQAKFVIGGQRMYEFFGIPRWQLPHWDGELIDFWQSVPFELKFGQHLYKQYLREWDYRGLFKNYSPFAWRWPSHMMWVVPLARLAGLLLGDAAKRRTYREFWYFSHYHNHYAMYGYRAFRRTLAHARSPISLQVERWLQENGHLRGELTDGTSSAGPRVIGLAGST